MSIHPTAVIDPSAQIGTHVEIGPFVYIKEGVQIGDNCKIISHAIIEHTELGEGCVVYPHVSLGTAPQHLQYNNEPTRLVVGKRTTFRECVTAHRGTALDKSLTRIGDDCYFMAYSHVAHDCIFGNNVIMANGAQVAGHVEVGNHCFISTTVGIHQGVRIGHGALVSGGAMVPLDVMPFCIAQGDRAHIKGLNIIGMRRQGLKRDDIKHVKAAFKTVFNSNLKLADALAHADLNVENNNIALIKEFLSQPKRGFLRPDAKESTEKEPALS